MTAVFVLCAAAATLLALLPVAQHLDPDVVMRARRTVARTVTALPRAISRRVLGGGVRRVRQLRR